VSRLVPPLLRENRAFRTFFSGQAVSLLGDQISLIAIPLVAVLVLDASPAEMGYLTTAALLPNLLSLHAGAWIDRRGRRRQTMIAADLGRAVLLVSIPVAYWLDALSFAQLYVVGFLAGLLSMLFSVSYSTLFVSLVPRDRYVEANSLLHGSRALSYVAGPSIGGLLVQLLRAPVALVADACSYVVSAISLARISPEEPPVEVAERGHLSAGMRYILRSPAIRASLGATATINLFNFVFFALFILYANRYLHVEPGVLGVVLGIGAVGGVAGAVLTGRIVRRIGLGPAYVLGCVLFPTPLVLVPLAGGPRWVVLACLAVAEFGSGFGVMLLDISGGTLAAAIVPDRLRARVSGAYMVVNYGVRPLGAFAGGLLGESIGVRPTLWIAVAGAIAGFLWLLPSPILRMRELPDTDDLLATAGSADPTGSRASA
jgi:predicted MFS family arabinose efflux permease